MYRQSPGRNHRSKRFKMRHVLQICLLLAVCFWLIYQVKHSHDKKKEFDESDDEKGSLERGTSDELLRLGRKDIRPLVEETDNKIERHDESVEEEEEENTRGEEDDVEENRMEHNVDGVIGDENEEMDEDEQEKSDAEIDREEEFVDDEKEKEENNDNVTEETDLDTEKHQIEKEDSTEESDSDGVDKSTHEAREEHYKADDASSAVSQDTHEKTNTKNENEDSKDRLEVKDNNGNDGEDTDKFQNGKDLNVEMAKDDNESNVTTSENGELHLIDDSDNGSPPNGTMTQGSEDNFTNNNSTNVAIENHDASSLNVTESDNKLDHGTGNLNETASKGVSVSDAIASEKMNNSSLNDDNNSLNSNLTSQLETKDTESNSEHGPEKIIKSEASMETTNSTEASTEKIDVTEGERSDTSGNIIDQNLESTDNGNHDEAEHDAIDISDSNNPLEEETNARTDLDTLPVIQSERTNDDDDDAAAE